MPATGSSLFQLAWQCLGATQMCPVSMDTQLLAAPTHVICVSKTQPGVPITEQIDCGCLPPLVAPAQTCLSLLCPGINARHGCLPFCSQALAQPATETPDSAALVTTALGSPSQPRMASRARAAAAWAAAAWAAVGLPWAVAADLWVAPHALGREHLPW